jgi:peptide subunit release factor 1 (eRF1)
MDRIPKIPKEASATSCVSLIAPKMSITELRSFIAKEKTTASNIRDNTNRKSVVAALGKIASKIDMMKSIGDNGIAMFAHSYI